MPVLEAPSEIIRKEIVNLHRVVYKSKLGKHITNNILVPILEKLDVAVDAMIDWMAFLLRDEIQFLLSTASPSGFVYSIYYVDPSMPAGQKSVKIGEYTPSERGGPPKSPVGSGGDMPQSGTLYQSIFYEIKGGTIKIGIRDLQSPYALWYNPDWPGKLFQFADNAVQPGRTSIYGPALEGIGGEGGYRPFWRAAMAKIRPELKRRFKEEFGKALQEATKRPTVKRAIVIRFNWESK
jgi:hypothetical protein